MDLSAEFPLCPGIVYLNHAAVAPWPRRTAEAVRRFADENQEQGALEYPRWLETEQRLREQLCTLINAPSADDIALVKNTSEALSFVAWGLDWQPGDSVVISDQEFPSNRIVWESLDRRGVQVRAARLDNAVDPEAALFAAVDGSTRLLAISSVQYASGLRMDLERIGAFCRQRGILFCIDAIQSIGALAFDVQAVQADFVAADGHKWLLGPEGLAMFYCRAELRDRLDLSQFGWHMVEHVGDYDRLDWQPATSARRFECGSPNMLGIHALSASISLLLEVGPARVEAELLERTGWLLGQIATRPELRLISSPTPSRRSGIVTFGHHALEKQRLHAQLWDNGVVCALRGGGVRLAPHFYTPWDSLEQVMRLVDQMGQT